ncbi:MAG: protein kinase domain-containing protein [Thermoanaerobaculia bacterium]
MNVEPGATLGRFLVGSRLGAGGMGEVWAARDETLGRSVALKILPEAFAADPERLSRWEREARLLASLNHPNIATLFGLERVEGRDILVLEKVAGQTLEERIAEGPIPVREALPLFAQIAAALEAAHEAGIVHRDLKPANIKVTPEGRVKVLDFGLAKLLAEGPTLGDESALPTLTSGPTGAGVVLGTVAYMSPEQARGRPVDKRTDIWAFGCTLFEALSGRPAFRGETPSDTLARVIEREPDWAALPDQTPPLARQLLRRCLRKEPGERLRDMGDARIEIMEAIAEADRPAPAAAPEPSGRRRRSALLAAVGFVLGAAAAGLAWRAFFSRAGAVGGAPAAARFTVRLPAGLGVTIRNSSSLAFSHDGTRIAFAARGRAESGLWIRRLDALEAARLPGTERARSPFFSPSDDWIGFDAGEKLKRLPSTGGTPQSLCELPYPAGASAMSDGSIVFVPSFTGGLFRLPIEGGPPQRLTTPDRPRGEFAHILPDALPDGRGVLFTLYRGEGFDQSSIAVLSGKTGKTRVVLDGGYHARWSPGGHVVFLRGSKLHAAPFDLERLAATGPAVAVLEGAANDAGSGAALFDVSPTGALAYVPGGTQFAARSLVRLDRSGKAETILEASQYLSPRVSPDGRRLALWIEDVKAQVCVYDLARAAVSRAAWSPDDHSPVWSPDGRSLAFESGREGAHQIYIGQADGTGENARVTAGEHHHYLTDWSRDGRWLAFVEFHPKTGADVWIAAADGRGEARPVVRTPSSEKEAAFSPDSRWLAYVSDESGLYEVYVQPFPGPGSRIQVSTGGGEEPAWSRDGRELFYRSGNRMMAVPVGSGQQLDPGKPEPLFTGMFFDNITPSRSYDVGPDGRFWMVTEPVGEELPQEIHVVLGFAEELRRRVPAGTR